jgi:hypothetical protein
MPLVPNIAGVFEGVFFETRATGSVRLEPVADGS